jgi:hypothetical protein
MNDGTLIRTLAEITRRCAYEEARADFLGQLADDYACWGVASEADRLRHEARCHRVTAMRLRALAGARMLTDEHGTSG